MTKTTIEDVRDHFSAMSSLSVAKKFAHCERLHIAAEAFAAALESVPTDDPVVASYLNSELGEIAMMTSSFQFALQRNSEDGGRIVKKAGRNYVNVR